MPSKDKKSVLLRQWELLRLLPSTGDGKSALELKNELAENGYDISKRQVERDLNELLEVFYLDINNDNTPQRWKWLKGSSVDLPGMTISDALSLHLVEETLKKLLPVSMCEGLESRFKQAEKQLIALGKENRKAKWASKVRTVSPTMPLIPPVINSEVLAVVQEALLDDVQIDMDYVTRDGRENKYRLNPLAIVNRGAVVYLIATTIEKEGVRLFALHRIRHAERTYEAARRPANFDVDEYINSGELHFGNGKEIKISAWIDDELARTLNETPLSIDQKLIVGGEYVKLTATVSDTWQLTWWLMSQGNSIEVTAPVSLRKKIGGLLRDAAAQYEEN